MEKTFIEPKYNEIKEYFKSKKYDKEKLNDMCVDLIELLGELTYRGVKEIDGEHLDKWKMRTSVILEKSGNLPPYREVDEDDTIGSVDNDWYGEEVNY